MKNIAIVLVAAATAGFGASCRRTPPAEPAVAIPSVSLAQNKAALGSPIDVTYRFEVLPSAPPFQENYRVFVGVVDADEEIMWHDDHDPPIPTTQWMPGQKIEYTRTVFIPVYPYVGDAAIHMGLHSTKTQKRLTLGGQDVGQRAYLVGKLQLLPQSDNILLVFKDGWHGIETPPDNPRVEWQWTKKKEATVAFKNPKRDVLVYLSLDNPSKAFPDGQKVQLELGGHAIDEFTLLPERELMHKIPVTASQFGPEDMVELKVVVDKTFVPALLQPPPNKDPRELGVRVFHLFVQPK